MKKVILFFCISYFNCFVLKAQNRNDSSLQKFERFSGTIKSKAFTDKGVGIYMFNQIIGERQNIKSFQTPFKGLAIVQLRGGKLKTISKGVTQNRTEGEIWTIPAHQSMQFLTDDDAATVQVIVINEDSVSSSKIKARKPGKDTVTSVNYTGYNSGIVKRRTYVTNTQSSFLVEIWDMMAALGKKSSKISFPGAAILEVRTGTGRFIVDGKTYEMKTGSTIEINEGSSLEIDTQRVQQPINFRVIIISSSN